MKAKNASIGIAFRTDERTANRIIMLCQEMSFEVSPDDLISELANRMLATMSQEDLVYLAEHLRKKKEPTLVEKYLNGEEVSADDLAGSTNVGC